MHGLSMSKRRYGRFGEMPILRQTILGEMLGVAEGYCLLADMKRMVLRKVN